MITIMSTEVRASTCTAKVSDTPMSKEQCAHLYRLSILCPTFTILPNNPGGVRLTQSFVGYGRHRTYRKANKTYKLERGYEGV